MPKFILKSVVENLNDVPEAYRSRYTERDDKFHLDEIEIDDFAEVKSELENERQGRTADKVSIEALMTQIVKATALDAGVLPEDIDDVAKVTRRRFDLRNNQIVVLDEAGAETSISLNTFFGEVFKSQKPKFYAAASTGEGNQLDRAAFDQMDPQKQMEFMKGGGIINDGAPSGSTGTSGDAAGKKTMPRSDFDKMPPHEQMAAVKSGAVIVD
jgi:hypothetical protein